MRRHAIDTVFALREDRKRGFTISQLMNKYSMPKTTVWHQIQGVVPTAEGAKIIKSSRGGNSARCAERWVVAQGKADTILNDFDEKAVWPTLLAALYWAEGNKKQSFIFTNTDEAMIRVFLKITRKYLKVPDKDLIILVRICDPMKPDVCKKYWSRVTGISSRNVQVNHHNSYNKSTTKHGMCRIVFRKGGSHLKLIHCIIRSITAKILTSP